MPQQTEIIKSMRVVPVTIFKTISHLIDYQTRSLLTKYNKLPCPHNNSFPHLTNFK